MSSTINQDSADQLNELLTTMRHSCAHVMATAIQKLWPNVKFGVGPVTENGFYYDFRLDTPLGEESLEIIEAEMRKICKAKFPIVRSELPIDVAIQKMHNMHQPYKVDLLTLLKEKGTTAVIKETGDIYSASLQNSSVETVTFYQIDDFIDLCRGPHLQNTGEIGAFKLQSISGAYWRGNEKNDQLQRIYGLCFLTKEELEKEIWFIDQKKLRDHRKIGKEINLFTFSEDVGQGLPLWLPNGALLRAELEYLAMKEERREGYQQVVTPHISKEALYYRSGHLPYYKEDMYDPINIEGENYYLKPMNCPLHHQIYLSKPRSYRNLPLRVTEYGQVYRYERSGALSGLMRTRGFCQNDAHIYCRFDQAKDEFIKVMHLHSRYYDLLGIKEYYMRLSLPDLNNLDKYVNEPEKWLAALSVIREAMKESGYPYKEAEGEAAFYGPKVDFMIKSAVGVEYAISTNQLDFLAAERFDLNYVGEDGQKHPVYVIHRAPLGSHERFVAFLIEHFAGAFPTWLAPIQARIIPINDQVLPYAESLLKLLNNVPMNNASNGLRVDIDDSKERMQKKIRAAQLEKIPYMLIVGGKEEQEQKVSVRTRSGGDLGPMSLPDFIEKVKNEIDNKLL